MSVNVEQDFRQDQKDTHVFFVQIRLSVFFTLQRVPIDFLVVTFVVLLLLPADSLAIVVKTLKFVLKIRP